MVPGVTFGRAEAVGPKVSGELFLNSLISLGLAMILVMAYIWLRFDFQFGVGAILSLFHDAILTLGVFSFFRIEFTLPVIAALLTVIGYSMNDTVVVYDRIGYGHSSRAADAADYSLPVNARRLGELGRRGEILGDRRELAPKEAQHTGRVPTELEFEVRLYPGARHRFDVAHPVDNPTGKTPGDFDANASADALAAIASFLDRQAISTAQCARG